MKRHFEKKVNFQYFKAVLGILWLSTVSASVFAVELGAVGVKEHLGQKIDLAGLQFIDSKDGKSHSLQEFFIAGQPTLINLVYFECPMVCTLVLNGVNAGLKELDWSIGTEFNVITISINPNDTSVLAKAKRENYLKSYLEKARNSEAANEGWHFLTGTPDQIQKIAEQLGFEYKYDAFQKEYLHPAVTFVLTSEGMISRYLYGISYKPKDLRIALLQASGGKLGSVTDRLLMALYHYEPGTSHYSLNAVSELKQLFQKIRNISLQLFK